MIRKQPVQGLQDALPQYQTDALPQNIVLQQAGDERDFGTPNFLGGPGGVIAHGFQTVLDAMPEGANLRGQIGAAPLQGLKQAQPQPQQPQPSQQPQQPNVMGVGTGSTASEQELRSRRARMLNQQQPAANFYPNATSTPYNPFPAS